RRSSFPFRYYYEKAAVTDVGRDWSDICFQRCGGCINDLPRVRFYNPLMFWWFKSVLDLFFWTCPVIVVVLVDNQVKCGAAAAARREYIAWRRRLVYFR